MPQFLRRIALVTFLGSLLCTESVFAAIWNPNKIVTDADLENTSTMSAAQIQLFLEQHGGLGSYVTSDIDGAPRSAAQIIARVSKTYHLNPQLLITLLQREQSLVDSVFLSDAQLDWAVGYAICDSCDKSDPALAQYRGFTNQLEQSAKRIRETFLTDIDQTGSTISGWGPGIAKIVDEVVVTPENRATATLYTYTPHIAGNYLFWTIWQKWFDLRYPDGSLLTSNDPYDDRVWMIDRGFKRSIHSRAALLSRFNPKNIVIATQQELARYPDGVSIRYSNYSLLRSPRGGVYLTIDDSRRGFPSLRVFRALGFQEDDIIDVTDDELEAYLEGVPLAATTNYPSGALLQDVTAGGIYFVQDGVKQPIAAREILKARFSNLVVTAKNPEELATYPTGAPVLFADGELIGARGAPDIYVVSDGLRRPIPSAEIFLGMGWDWQDVIWTSEKAVLIHPLGEPIIPDQNLETPITVTNF